MLLSQSYGELLDFLSGLLPIMHQHQSNFIKRPDLNHTQQIQQSFSSVTQNLNDVLQNITSQQSLAIIIEEPSINNIFQAATPEYRTYYKTNVLVPRVGFRFIKFKGKNYNYIVTRIVDTKTAEVQQVTFMGKPITGSTEIIRLSRNHYPNTIHEWVFNEHKETEEYRSYYRVNTGVANDEGVEVKSPDDPAINYKLTTHYENDIAIPEINLLGRVVYHYTDYPYVVISINPLIMKYIGKQLSPHEIYGELQDKNWKIINVNNPEYKGMIENNIKFGELAFENWEPPT